MKNYLSRNERFNNGLDIFSSALNDWFKPMFFDENDECMKTDISECDGGYLMEIEMPGLEKKDISVNYEDGYVTVKAEKSEKEESDKKDKYLRKERSVSYCRSYYVGEISEKDIKAKYLNGVLSVNVPKKEERKPDSHNIDIE